jgi:hypothetical protein
MGGGGGGGGGGGDFSNGLIYKRQKTVHTLYVCTNTISHGMVYFPDPVEDIRNPLNK